MPETLPFTEVCSSRDRTHWLDQRRTGIGASEVAALIGASEWASPLSLYAQKLGIAPDDAGDSEAMEWGTRLEPAIIQAFGERTGRDVEPCGLLLRSAEFPFALATLDAWCIGDDGARWPLEIKTTGAHRAEAWEDGPPPAYVAQVQWQMLVAGCERATVACLIGGQRMVWADMDRDPVLLSQMVAAARDFWACVESQTPPPVDGSEASRTALAQVYPTDTGAVVELGPELCEVADALEAAKESRAAAEREIVAAENMLKGAIKGAAHGVLPDGRSFTWKLQSREGYWVKPSQFRVFRANKPKESAK
jgi:putative phage-type endonuclease